MLRGYEAEAEVIACLSCSTAAKKYEAKAMAAFLDDSFSRDAKSRPSAAAAVVATKNAGSHSIDQFQSEFEDARRTGASYCAVSASRFARRVKSRGRIDSRERWVIDDVERLSAELQPHSFIEIEVFKR